MSLTCRQTVVMRAAHRFSAGIPAPIVGAQGGDCMRLRHALLMPVLALSFLTGCVERRFLVVSDPSGASVLVNHVPLNTYTPADGSYLYTGYYNVTVIKDAYE